MHRRELILFKRMLTVWDLVMTSLAFLATFHFRQWLAYVQFDGGAPRWFPKFDVPLVDTPEAYYAVMVGILPIWAFALFVSNTADFRSTTAQIGGRFVRAVAIGLVILLAGVFLLKLQFIARTFVVMFGVANVALLIIGRYALMETIALLRAKRVDGHRVVVIGCGQEAVAYASSIRSQPPWNVKLLGHVSVEGETSAVAPQDTLERIENLHHLLDSTPVDEVLFAYPDLESELLANALHACDERGVDVLIPLPPTLPQRARVEVANLEGFDLPLLGLRRTPSGEVRIAAKRLLDIGGSLALLLAASPVMLLVALAIRLETKGPILFKQTRAGRNGRKFVMYKFRSMVVDAEARRAALAHLNEMSGPVFKIRRDPRITRVGAFIRKTSLDELPQLFNILFGDMSLVGPRPPLPSEVAQYKPWQRRRLSVKPGLTGLWQVSGRNNVDFEEWMALDLRYIDDWSLWLDVKILLRTLPAVLFKTGAS